jgi:hypothetical protein
MTASAYAGTWFSGVRLDVARAGSSAVRLALARHGPVVTSGVALHGTPRPTKSPVARRTRAVAIRWTRAWPISSIV